MYKTKSAFDEEKKLYTYIFRVVYLPQVLHSRCSSPRVRVLPFWQPRASWSFRSDFRGFPQTTASSPVAVWEPQGSSCSSRALLSRAGACVHTCEWERVCVCMCVWVSCRRADGSWEATAEDWSSNDACCCVLALWYSRVRRASLQSLLHSALFE